MKKEIKRRYFISYKADEGEGNMVIGINNTFDIKIIKKIIEKDSKINNVLILYFKELKSYEK